MLGFGYKIFFYLEKNGVKGRKCQDVKKKKKSIYYQNFFQDIGFMLGYKYEVGRSLGNL